MQVFCVKLVLEANSRPNGKQYDEEDHDRHEEQTAIVKVMALQTKPACKNKKNGCELKAQAIHSKCCALQPILEKSLCDPFGLIQNSTLSAYLCHNWCADVAKPIYTFPNPVKRIHWKHAFV